MRGDAILPLRTRQLRARRLALAHQAEAEAAQVKALPGLVPVCSWCKRIRDQVGDWVSLERFIARSARAEISHGRCPDCFREQEEKHRDEPWEALLHRSSWIPWRVAFHGPLLLLHPSGPARQTGQQSDVTAYNT